MRLYWLLNRLMPAECGYYDEYAEPPTDGPPYFWVSVDYGLKHFMYIPLTRTESAELLKMGTITVQIDALSDRDSNGHWWIHNEYITSFRRVGGLSDDELRVTKDVIFAQRADIKNIRECRETPAADTFLTLPISAQRGHVSDKLATLNQASATHWANADREDRGTHPKNADVGEWLSKLQLREVPPPRAARSEGPEWAPTGRKPDE